MPFDGAEVDAVGAVLLKAAALVEQGWCQHDAEVVADGMHLYCAVGAIVEFTLDNVSAERAARTRVQRLLPGIAIEDWNDAEGRTQEEVVALLRRAAWER